MKILTPSLSANYYASGVILTSKAKRVANSFFLFFWSPWSALVAFKTSFLWTGPIEIDATGILAVVFKNSRSASKEPNVEAWTQTPSEFLSTYLSKISIKLSSISAFAAAISASLFALSN